MTQTCTPLTFKYYGTNVSHTVSSIQRNNNSIYKYGHVFRASDFYLGKLLLFVLVLISYTISLQSYKSTNFSKRWSCHYIWLILNGQTKLFSEIWLEGSPNIFCHTKLIHNEWKLSACSCYLLFLFVSLVTFIFCLCCLLNILPVFINIHKRMHLWIHGILVKMRTWLSNFWWNKSHLTVSQANTILGDMTFLKVQAYEYIIWVVFMYL